MTRFTIFNNCLNNKINFLRINSESERETKEFFMQNPYIVRWYERVLISTDAFGLVMYLEVVGRGALIPGEVSG